MISRGIKRSHTNVRHTLHTPRSEGGGKTKLCACIFCGGAMNEGREGVFVDVVAMFFLLFFSGAFVLARFVRSSREGFSLVYTG